MTHRFFLSFVAAGFLLLGAFAAEPKSEVKVTVTDANGAVIVGSEVMFKGDSVTTTARTGEYGSVTVQLPSGKYTATITAPLFLTAKQDFQVSAPTPAQFRVALEIDKTPIADCFGLPCPVVDTLSVELPNFINPTPARGSTAALAQTGPAATALDALRKAHPDVNWDEKSSILADVECDGVPRTLLVGYQSDQVWLGVVGSAGRSGTPKAETFSFLVGEHTQDSFCATPVRIEIAPLDCDGEQGSLRGCKPVKGCREFSLVDGSCDSFHFYWDSARRRLTWWRR